MAMAMANATTTSAAEAKTGPQRTLPIGSNGVAAAAVTHHPSPPPNDVGSQRSSSTLNTSPLLSRSPSTSTSLSSVSSPRLHQYLPQPSESPANPPLRARPLRKTSPGLQARMRLFDQAEGKSRVVSSPTLVKDKIGRVPDRTRTVSTAATVAGKSGSDISSDFSSNPEQAGTPAPVSGGYIAPSTTLHPVSPHNDDNSDCASSIVSLDRNMVEDTDGSEGYPSPIENHKFRLPEHKSEQKPLPGTPSNEQTLQRDSLFDPSSPSTARPTTGHSRSASTEDVTSYFNPYGLQRTASIYTLSKDSFANQMKRLAAVQLPPASVFAVGEAVIPNVGTAVKKLSQAGSQIGQWMHSAREILSGLDAEDDVEWASAGGRDGIGEVDKAVQRFEAVVSNYVNAVEELQLRPDVSAVPSAELKTLVDQMDKTFNDFEEIRKSLTSIKQQVELSMEWEELWNTVLGEIGLEIDELSTMVYEIEDKREDANGEAQVDMGELATIVEEGDTRTSLSLLSTPQGASRLADPTDSSLLALNARMQPLRASLDFLPMRLSTFQLRANMVFPSACSELHTRRDKLEEEWESLSGDVERLQRELGEDRWTTAFRNWGRQCNKMCDVIDHSMHKVRELLESGVATLNPALFYKKADRYELEKKNWGPAVERILTLIEKGLNDRLTVSDDILKLETDVRVRWKKLKSDMKIVDDLLAEQALNSPRTQHLRDSVSSIMTADRSFADGSMPDTPVSSPASSIINVNTSLKSQIGQMRDPSTPAGSAGKPRSGLLDPRRSNGSSIPRQPISFRTSTSSRITPPSTGPYGNKRHSASSVALTPTPHFSRRVSATPVNDGRPRWNASTNTNELARGVAALSTEPTSQAKPALRRPASQSFTSSVGGGSGTSTPKLFRPSTSLANRPSLIERQKLYAANAANGNGNTTRRTSLTTNALSHLPQTPSRPQSSMSMASYASIDTTDGKSRRRRSFLPRPTTPSSSNTVNSNVAGGAAGSNREVDLSKHRLSSQRLLNKGSVPGSTAGHAKSAANTAMRRGGEAAAQQAKPRWR